MEISYPRDCVFKNFKKLINENGITIDRPIEYVHPEFPDFMYTIDYGYINTTTYQDVGVAFSLERLITALQVVFVRLIRLKIIQKANYSIIAVNMRLKRSSK